MKIQWLGHSCFLITSDSGVRLVTDPYESGSYDGTVKYDAFSVPADVVTQSHDHPDHAHVKAIQGNPMIIRNAGMFVAAGIEITGVQTMHDTVGGAERGKNVVFTFVIDDIKLCHLGDLGHRLTPEQASQIGAVDVLFAPVGGYFTIGHEEAWAIARELNAKIVIPMHFKTEALDFPVQGVDAFLEGKENTLYLGASTMELNKGSLPSDTQIVVLKHAC